VIEVVSSEQYFFGEPGEVSLIAWILTILLSLRAGCFVYIAAKDVRLQLPLYKKKIHRGCTYDKLAMHVQ
jgi:hypothetical protein